jgi:hypothetical protein
MEILCAAALLNKTLFALAKSFVTKIDLTK